MGTSFHEPHSTTWQTDFLYYDSGIYYTSQQFILIVNINLATAVPCQGDSKALAE